MNKKIKIIISIIFLFVIAGGIIFFFKSDNKNLTSELFIVKDTSEISKVVISQDSEKIILTINKKNRSWTVDNKYPANKKAVKKLFQTLTEVKISKPVLKSEEDSILNFIKSKGKKVTIYNNDNQVIKNIIIGSYSKNVAGTYMLNPDINTPFITNIPGVENDLNYRYNINPVYWLKPEIFSYSPNEIKEITLKYSDSNKQSFKLIILSDTANLVNLSDNLPVKNLSLNKVGSYLSYFMNVKFSSETSDTENLKNQLLKKIPFAELNVTDINKKIENIKLYQIPNSKKQNEYDLNNLYAVINNQDVVLVKYVDFDLILKDIHYFTN